MTNPKFKKGDRVYDKRNKRFGTVKDVSPGSPDNNPQPRRLEHSYLVHLDGHTNRYSAWIHFYEKELTTEEAK
jgi:hypothetical protein